MFVRCIEKRKPGPLSYPGGKSYAVKKIVNYFPIQESILISPFVGGGHIEINCASTDMVVRAYDINKDLVNFWQVLLNQTDELVDFIANHPDKLIKEKELFKEYQKKLKEDEDSFNRAAWYYIINQNSYGGAGQNYSNKYRYDKRRKKQRQVMSPKKIKRLKQYKNYKMTVGYMHFKESIIKHRENLFYLDPPYLIESENMYGNKGEFHKGFDHKLLRECLGDVEKFVLSYNDCEEIRDMYSGYTQIQLEWTYLMTPGERPKGKELLIISKEVERMLKNPLS